MKLYPTEQFVKCYEDLSQNVQKQTDKQLELLLTNFRHPSLRTKKIRAQIISGRQK